MAADSPPWTAPRGPARAARITPLVLGVLVLATVIALVVWARHAPRFLVFSAASYGDFWDRRGWMLAHVAGGTVPLLIGPFVLGSGLRRWRPALHRLLGRTYLLTGAVGVGAGAALSAIAAAPPRGLYVATFVLALAWFACAGMAYRAIRHRRIEQHHRQWMVRSYVLTFTFVAPKRG